MFTGIITNTTKIVSSSKKDTALQMVFDKPKDWTDLALGESVSSNGVCLTVASQDTGTYTCDIIPETLHVSTFGQTVPKHVNLERSLKAGDRLGGHFVQGHVDDIGTVGKIDTGKDYRLTIEFNAEQAKYVVYKGTIIVDGVALTVAETTDNTFTVALAPYTLEHTTLRNLGVGDKVNLEFDMIGKYIVNILEEK